MTTILLAAAEPSGDGLGAALMKALKAERPDLRFVGGGGPLMREAGLENPLDTERLAVMGPVDALAALPRAKSLARELAQLAKEEKPAAAVLIDSWVFSKMTAEAIKKTTPEMPLIKLGVPQVWASRPHRATTAAQLFDLLLCLLPFEPPYFEKAGGQAVFVGNPNFEAAAQQPRSGPAFRARYQVGDAQLLLMLPGSRRGEVKHHLPVFRETAMMLAPKNPGLHVAIIAAGAVEETVRQEVAGWDLPVIIVPPDERFDAFDAGDVALTASGTVTTELALAGTPMVVVYKVGKLVAYWAKKVITTPYITILNIASDDMVIPERLQDDCQPAQLTADVSRLLHDEEARRRQLSAFRRLLPTLIGSRSAAEAASEAVLDLVDGKGGGDLNGRAAR